MEFKVGQKYRIVDIDAWWDKEKYVNDCGTGATQNFNNGDIIYVGWDVSEELCFLIDSASSREIDLLIKHKQWHDSCIELIPDEESDQSDDTISLCHIADVLEDALAQKDFELRCIIQECIKSLRKDGY